MKYLGVMNCILVDFSAKGLFTKNNTKEEKRIWIPNQYFMVLQKNTSKINKVTHAKK